MKPSSPAALDGVVEVDGRTFIRRAVLRRAFCEILDEFLFDTETDTLKRKLQKCFDEMLPSSLN
jgi:hypothetical protein